MLMVISVAFCTTDVNAATKGKDYDNSAYYDVSWLAPTLSEDTYAYYSRVAGAWDDVNAAKGAFSYYNIPTFCEAAKVSENGLFWYGWVDENGKWHGHINGTPTVTNTISGEKVTVTKWKADITQIFAAPFPYTIGSWSVTGTGASIDKDTIKSGLPQVTAGWYDENVGSNTRSLAIRLYLSDGNSIKLSYSSGTSGKDQSDAITAQGGRMTAYMYWYTNKKDKSTWRGNNSLSVVYLNSPKEVEDYHFYVEFKITGAKKNSVYTVPVKVSINGGSPITMYFKTKGNGTVSKEVSFKGYKGTYNVSAIQDKANTAKELVIVQGSDTAKASISSVEQSNENTAVIEDTIVKNNSNNSSKDKTSKGVNTGDNTSVMIYVVLGIISLGGITAVAIAKRKMQ